MKQSLPTSVIVQLLMEISQFRFNPSISPVDMTLDSLLTAYPPLAQHILVVSDHPENPHELVGLEGFEIPSMSIYEYDILVKSLSPRPPRLVFLSFIKGEEKTNTPELSYSQECLYARHMESMNTFVLIRCFSSESICREFFLHHFENTGVFHATFRWFGRPMPKSWVHFDGLTDRPLRDEDVRDETVTRWESNGHNPIFYRTSRYPPRFSAKCFHKITTLSINNYTVFIKGISLPWVTKARISMPLCLGDRTYSMDHIKTSFNCNLPRVNNLHIEFHGLIPPDVLNTSAPTYDHISQIGNKNSNPDNAIFTFSTAENAWTPSRSRITDGKDATQYTDDLDYISKNYRSMTFLERFGVHHYRGVSDETMKRSRLSGANTIYWERLTVDYASQGNNSYADVQFNGYCPRLRKLTLTSCVRAEGKRIPTFECPKLESLKVVSLHGSDKKWSLSELLQNQLPKNLRSVEIHGYWWLQQHQEQLPMESSDISFIAPLVEQLSVKGHTPDFVLSQMGKGITERQLYPRLKDLTIDVTRIPLCTSLWVSCSKAATILIDFYNDSFPVLQRVSLVIPYGGTIGVTGGMRAIVMSVSPTCTTVELSSTLITDGKDLIINGEKVDQPNKDDAQVRRETKRTGRVWKRVKTGSFKFYEFKILEELEGSIVF